MGLLLQSPHSYLLDSLTSLDNFFEAQVIVLVRRSFILRLIGGIISFLVGFFEFFIGAANQAFNSTSFGLEYLMIVSFLAGIFGIVGRAVGEKKGGILMIIGAIFALIGRGLFGVLALVLLIVGGILAIKE